MQELISVIIPAYNIEKWIGRCLDSVINQSYLNLQIIVVNDGSSDSTGMILDTYASKDSRIKVIHQENQGVSAARNAGMSEAKGSYICFVDGDDWVDADYIKAMYTAFKGSNIQMTVCGFVEEDEEGQLTQLRNNQDQHKWSKEILEQIFFAEEIGRSLWNKMFLREIIESKQLRFSSEHQVGEDMLFLVKYLLCIDTVKCIDHIGYHYLWRVGSAMNKRQWDERYDRSRNSWLKVLEEIEILLGSQSDECRRNLQMYRRLVQYRILCESVSLVGNAQKKRKLEQTLLQEVRKCGTTMLCSDKLSMKTKLIIL